MKMKPKGHSSGKKGGLIAKEFLVGLLSIGLGAYNLLVEFNVLPWNYELPQVIANILLIIAGLFVWGIAYKLWRHRYHQSQFFE
jgi:uncharacterized integral membrane protein